MRPSSLLHRAAILFSTLLLAITPLAASAEAFIFTVDGGNLASRHFTGTSWLTVLDFIPVSVYGVPAWGGSDFIRLGDFNGDGRFEVASPRGGHILVKYVDTRLNSLNSAPPASVSGQWGGASYVRVGDFNGDGRDDFASPNGGSVYMKLGRSGVYRFDSQTWGVQPSWGGSAYTFVGDFNGDGRDDIASGSGGSMYMKISTGSGFISQTWNVSNEWASGGYTWVGDFNGDGRDDIASARNGLVHMKLSRGNAFTSTSWSVANQWGGGGYTWAMDYDGDGRKDIVSASGGNLYVKRNVGGTRFVSETWPIRNEWGSAAFTWASDRF